MGLFPDLWKVHPQATQFIKIHIVGVPNGKRTMRISKSWIHLTFRGNLISINFHRREIVSSRLKFTKMHAAVYIQEKFMSGQALFDSLRNKSWKTTHWEIANNEVCTYWVFADLNSSNLSMQFDSLEVLKH